MILLEKSELSFSKCPTKNYITPPPEKCQSSRKEEPQSPPKLR